MTKRTLSELLDLVEAAYEAVDVAGGLPHVVGPPLDAGHAPKFVKKALDVVEVAEADEAADDVLEGADDAQGPAQTHADVVDDVLAADTGPMSLRKVRKVVLPSFENRKTNHNKSS